MFPLEHIRTSFFFSARWTAAKRLDGSSRVYRAYDAGATAV